MAAFVATETRRFFDPTPVTLDQLHKRAGFTGQTVTVGGFTIDVPEAALRRLYGRPTFEIFGTTDTNTAAASSPVISLSDNGVYLLANTYRDIEVETLAFNGANRFKWRTRQRVRGGSEVTLEGPQQFLTECMALVEATTDGSTTSVETTNCRAPAWWDGATPLIGAFSTGQATISWLGANNPVGSLVPIGANHAPTTPGTVANDKFVLQAAVSLANGTSQMNTIGGTTDFALGLAAGTVQATAFITPPVDAPVLIDTASSPDEVFIGALGLSSDVVTWQIKVFVGELITDGPLV